MGTITYFGDRTSGAFLIIVSVSRMKITRFHGPITVFNSREVKHDVYCKQQKLNFCLLYSALCTVELKYLYLL